MMKKVFALLLALCLALSLAACAAPIDPETLAGKVDGRSYTNQFFNLRCSLPAGWSFRSEEEIAELLEIPAEEYTGKSFSQKLQEEEEVVDMIFDAPTGTALEFVIAGNSALNNNISEQAVLEASIEDTISSRQKEGYTDVTAEIGTTQFLGADKPCIQVNMKYMNVDFYEKILFFKGSGEYIAYITMFYLEEDDAVEALNCFSKLN